MRRNEAYKRFRLYATKRFIKILGATLLNTITIIVHPIKNLKHSI